LPWKVDVGAYCLGNYEPAGARHAGIAVVGVQESAKSLGTDALALVSFVWWLDALVDVLVNFLMMVER
jgi:hypothetical protein